jgi:hypothetical protein
LTHKRARLAFPAQKPIRSGNRFADEDRNRGFLISWSLLRPGRSICGVQRNNCAFLPSETYSRGKKSAQLHSVALRHLNS